MITIDRKLISDLLDKAADNPRLRQNYDLRTSPAESCQRMLNALMPGTQVPIHRHPDSSESVVLICGKIVEVIYDDAGNEVERYLLDISVGNFGCVVPAGAWHTVEVLEPSVIMEVKAGRYGEHSSETMEQVKVIDSCTHTDDKECSDSLNHLKHSIEALIKMERLSGSMDVITHIYVSRMLNVPLKDVEKAMMTMNL